MTIQELRTEIEKIRTERDNAIEKEKDFDKFEALSEIMIELSGALYRAELKEYIASI